MCKGMIAAAWFGGEGRPGGANYVSKFKIIIDCEACIGDQLCAQEAPETFDMNDDDKAIVIDPEGNCSEEIKTAAVSCPVDAIKLIDEATGEQVWPDE